MTPLVIPSSKWDTTEILAVASLVIPEIVLATVNTWVVSPILADVGNISR